MGLVTGNNLTIYAGDDMNPITCEESCSIVTTTEEIITTTKGSGRGTNREYGRYDSVLSYSGIVYIYASEADAAAANRQDGTYFHSYIVQGKKVCAKYQMTDGGITKYIIANWIVRSCSITGAAGNFATLDIELALDGQLYESAAMQSGSDYDGPSVYIYEATGAVSNFDATPTINASRIYFVVKKTAATGITTILTVLYPPDDFTPANDEVIYVTGTGNFEFYVALADGDIVLISYDPSD